MDEKKAEFLEWLLRPRNKDYPFVTYRSAAMKAQVNLEIPFDDIAEFFSVDSITIRGQVWEKKKPD